jgi:hypothetical protein
VTLFFNNNDSLLALIVLDFLQAYDL